MEIADYKSDAELSKLFYDVIDGKVDIPPSIQGAFDSLGGIKALREMKNKELSFQRHDFISYAKDFRRVEQLKLSMETIDEKRKELPIRIKN